MVAAVLAEELRDLLDVGVGDAVGVAAGEEARQGFEMIGEEEVVVVEIGDEPAARGVEAGVQRPRPAVRGRAVQEREAAVAGRRQDLLRRCFAAVGDDQGLEVAERLGAEARQSLPRAAPAGRVS